MIRETSEIYQFRIICVSFDIFGYASPYFNEYEYMVTSSPKFQTSVSLMKNIRSFMKRSNKIGPNIDPFRTPLGISR